MNSLQSQHPPDVAADAAVVPAGIPPGGETEQRPREKTKQEVFRRSRRGESVEALARRFRLSPSEVQQILAEMRFQRILQLPLDYMPSDEFKPDLPEETQRQLLAPPPASKQPLKAVRPPKGLPAYLTSLYEVPLLTREQEAHLFRKMNYLKYKACQSRKQLAPVGPDHAGMDRIERLYHQSVGVKNEIIRANLRLVVSIAKRHATDAEHLFELISDGNVSLIRAVDKFDYSRGFRFSTYASWALMKNYARTIPTEQRHQTRFRTRTEQWLQAAEDERARPSLQEGIQSHQQQDVARILGHLNQRERELIRYRFGLEGRQPMTLKDIGEKLGVSKERARQLESRAMTKLREAVAEEKVEAPEDSR